MDTKTILRRMARMSEDALEDLLETLEPNSETYLLVNTELDSRAEKLSTREEEFKLAKARQQAALALRMAELEALTAANTVRCIMQAYVLAFGEEFRDDYHIGDDFTVHSLVAKTRRLDQIDTWHHESYSDALAKVNQLIYYRVYDQRVRNGISSEDLLLIKTAILEIKAGNLDD